MTAIRRWKRPAATVLAGLLAASLIAGCDDPAAEEEAAAGSQAPELSPGASAETVKNRKKAQLQLNIEPQGYLFIEGRHRFTQTRVFTESGGVGVTITNGKVCVSYGKECVEADVTYRIDSGKNLALTEHYVATETLPDEAVIEYWGLDDNGNPISVSAQLPLILPKQGTRE